MYFSPNTHLLGEAVALHALGILLPGFPRAREWEQAGSRIVREQMDFQVRPDGSLSSNPATTTFTRSTCSCSTICLPADLLHSARN